MKQATYFIEQYNSQTTGNCFHSLNPLPIKELENSLLSTASIKGWDTIAIFKVYPHPKPVIAEYDKEINAIIVSNE